jgi:23S rRNA (cytosine1962-C5)-methyltransferase
LDSTDDTKFTLPPILDGEDKSSLLGNCLRNHYRHLRKWAKRCETNCFRIYDKEMRQYPLAIDFYNGRFCVHYFSPARGDEDPSKDLVDETTKVLENIFGAKQEDIYWRTRIKREKSQQYEKAGESKDFFTVTEYGVQFLVNLVDYLDTGLFLDHRETRQIVAKASQGKRLLNLFAYTCSFSVQAAAQGAAFTKSVDMSNTYTQWGRENFAINGLPARKNEIIRADCLKFLDEEVRTGNKYDVIVIDPPTISRSKKMDKMFDIQLDFIYLISKAIQLLDKKGVIFFSTNSRQFVFGDIAFQSCEIEEITHKTIPQDFPKSKIHRCWKISLQS